MISTPFGPVGLLICWDLAFPKAWRELALQDAKVIIVPTLGTRTGASEAGRRENPFAPSLFLDSILTARTFGNTCTVVFANAGGLPERNYTGLSQINIPYAGPLVRLGTPAEGMSVATIDLAVLEEAEQNYAIRAGLAGIYNLIIAYSASVSLIAKKQMSLVFICSGLILHQVLVWDSLSRITVLDYSKDPPMASTDNPNNDAAKDVPLPTRPESPWQQAHGTAASYPE